MTDIYNMPVEKQIVIEHFKIWSSDFVSTVWYFGRNVIEFQNYSNKMKILLKHCDDIHT